MKRWRKTERYNKGLRLWNGSNNWNNNYCYTNEISYPFNYRANNIFSIGNPDKFRFSVCFYMTGVRYFFATYYFFSEVAESTSSLLLSILPVNSLITSGRIFS